MLSKHVFVLIFTLIKITWCIVSLRYAKIRQFTDQCGTIGGVSKDDIWVVNNTYCACRKIFINIPDCDFNITMSFTNGFRFNLQPESCSFTSFTSFYYRLLECENQNYVKTYLSNSTETRKKTDFINFRNVGDNTITVLKAKNICRIQINLNNFGTNEYLVIDNYLSKSRSHQIVKGYLNYYTIDFYETFYDVAKIFITFHKEQKKSFVTILQDRTCRNYTYFPND